MSVDELLKALGPGAAGPLVVFILALWHQDIVLGWQYLAMKEDRDFWRAAALTGTEAAEHSTHTAAKLAEKVQRE